LMNRNFLLLWQGQTVSLIGTQISIIAMVFWLKHTTESPALMGMVTMFSGLATVMVAPIGGALADRYSRRWIIVLCDLVGGLAVISLSLWMIFAPAATGWTLAGIFAVLILLSVADGFTGPAIAASIPDLAPKEKVPAANSMFSAAVQISTLVGKGIGGALFRLLGAPFALLLDGVTYLYCAFTECFVAIPQTLEEKKGDWREEIRGFGRQTWEGVGYVRANIGLTQLILIASLSNFFIAPMLALFPFYVEDHLKLHSDWYGYLLAIYGLGKLLGYLLAGIVTVPGKTRAVLIIACMLIEASLYGLMGVVNTAAAVAIIMMVGATATGFMSVSIITILQLTTPSEIRGRVFGLLGTVTACLIPIGAGISGWVASLTGKNIAVIYIFCACVMAFGTVPALFLKGFRSYLATDLNERQDERQDEQQESIPFEQRKEEMASAD
jgi:MFS family permease